MKMKYIIVLILILFFSFVSSFSFNGWFLKESVVDRGENVSLDNLREVLADNAVVGDLPRDAAILVELYGDLSERYLVRRGNVSLYDDSSVDFVLGVDSGYLGELSSVNYCEVGGKILRNGDFWYRLNSGRFGLVWKYRGMFRYASCFGF